MAKNKINNRMHIIKRASKWVLLKEGAERVSRICTTKEEAIQVAQKYKSDGFDLIIHKSDGSIQEWEKSF